MVRDTLQKREVDFLSVSELLRWAEECFCILYLYIYFGSWLCSRRTELTSPCFAGSVSALGRAEFRILQEAGTAPLASQCVPQALDLPWTVASSYLVWCDSRPTSYTCCLLGGAKAKLWVLSVLWNSASVRFRAASQNKAEVEGVEQPSDSSTQLAASSQGTAEWVSLHMN